MVTYPLPEILFVLFIGQLRGMADVDECVVFAKAKIDWLRGLFRFESGIAPTQTIRRVLAVADNKIFETQFTAWHRAGVVRASSRLMEYA